MVFIDLFGFMYWFIFLSKLELKVIFIDMKDDIWLYCLKNVLGEYLSILYLFVYCICFSDNNVDL